MKSVFPSAFVLLFILGLAVCPGLASAQDTAASENFPGVKKALTPDQYAATGLDKLTPEERANLDSYLKGYFSGATQQVVQQAVAKASAQAVDQAVKERKVEPPTLIESKIVGTVSGWSSNGTVFLLENGQRWKTTDNERRYFTPLTNPDVFIVKESLLGYRMAIAGGGAVRVRRVQ